MTDDDRKLLERAARAAGYKPVRLTDDGTALLLEGVQRPWNPLHENPHSDCMGDALRLAVALEIQAGFSKFSGCGFSSFDRGWRTFHEYGPDDCHSATRRAITRAAAEMAP